MGEPLAGLRIWEEAERRFGPSIQLRADICALLFQLRDFPAFFKKSMELECAYEAARDRLSPASRARACAILSGRAKSQGRIALALARAEEGLGASAAVAAAAAAKPSETADRARLLAQKLSLEVRFSAKLRAIESTSAALRQALEQIASMPMPAVDGELALALAEVALGKTAAAKERVAGLLSRKGLSTAEIWACWSAFAAELLLTGLDLSSHAPACPTGSPPPNSFEDRLRSLERPLADSDARLTPVQQLVIWTLQARAGVDFAATARASLHSALGQLDERDRELLAWRLDLEGEPAAVVPDAVLEVAFDSETGVARSRLGSACLAKRAQLRAFFEALLAKQAGSAEAIAAAIAEKARSPIGIERLRASCQKLNQALAPATGEHCAIQFSNSIVRLNPALSFRRR
jgi:hypothetical protein